MGSSAGFPPWHHVMLEAVRREESWICWILLTSVASLIPLTMLVFLKPAWFYVDSVILL